MQSERADVRILVGTPCTQDGVSEQYLHSILALQRRCDELDWDIRVVTRADGLVTRTRNIFASRVVLSDNFTHLMMIDADMGFEPAQVERLVESGHEVVGASVPLREVRWDRVESALAVIPDLTAEEMRAVSHGFALGFLREQPRQRPVNGFLPVRFVGSAMLLARREALLRLANSNQVVAYERGAPWSDWGPNGWTFFDPMVDPEDGNYLSEDYAFCLRWRAVGGEVWADLRSAIDHAGVVKVVGDTAKSLDVARRVRQMLTDSLE